MKCQAPSQYRLETRWIGGLPIVNALLKRLRVDELLAEVLPAPDIRSKLAPSAALGVLLRNIILNERQPLYTQGEWVAQAEPALLGLKAEQLDSRTPDIGSVQMANFCRNHCL